MERHDGDRVVLFLDIKRPLRPPVNWINNAIIGAVATSSFIKAARAQHVAREERFSAAWHGEALQERNGTLRPDP